MKHTKAQLAFRNVRIKKHLEAADPEMTVGLYAELFKCDTSVIKRVAGEMGLRFKDRGGVEKIPVEPTP